MINLNRVLIPHDFSETSQAAVKYGVEFARKFGARLYVLHVGERLQAEMAMEFPLGLDAEAAIRERMLRVLTPLEHTELKPEFAVAVGTPATEIVRYAKEQKIDMIVMGTHGRGLVAHAVLGSVAEKVVRHAPCAVMTVHAVQPEFVMAEDRPAPAVRP